MGIPSAIGMQRLACASLTAIAKRTRRGLSLLRLSGGHDEIGPDIAG